ncbi:MAG: nucleotidyl transferase AbiEii/AbiGii toxin family protein [bacterium]
MAREKLPLATIQNAVLEFLRDRKDAVVFGAQAVNAYVKEPRMTQDIDLLSTRAEDLAGELQEYLRQQFRIAVRVREIGKGKGYRLYQVQKTGNRHLVDIRPVATLPPTKRISKVLVVTPPELIANKVISYHQRRGKPKSGTDWRDLAMLLLTFPELKHKSGPVLERLQAAEVDPAILSVWNELVTQEITPADDDEF